MEMTDAEYAELRCLPSIPPLPLAQSVSWTLAVSASGEKRLFGKADSPDFSLGSAELSWITRFAAQRRFEMDGEPALNPYECPDEPRFRADAYTFETLPDTQTAVLWSRLPGIGWVRLQLDANEMRAIAEGALSILRPLVTSTRAH